MTKFLLLAGMSLLTCATLAVAQEKQENPDEKKETIKATYLMTGLHCEPCTGVVESSLTKVKGVRSIKVDWKTKEAKVEFDESIVPSQKIEQLIAATPHMMGSSMHYDGWLVLRAPEIKDDATAKHAVESIKKIEGVKTVVPYPAQHAIGIQFGPKGNVTTKQLIEALKSSGFTSTT